MTAPIALGALALIPAVGAVVALRIVRAARRARRRSAPGGGPFRADDALAVGEAPPRSVRVRAGCFFIALGLIGLWLAQVCGAATWRYAWGLNLAHRSPTFPQTMGQVVSSEVVPGELSDYVPRVTYRYEVGARVYVSDVWRPNPRGVAEELDARLIAGRYEPGERVVVAYDPAEPGRAVLEHGMVGAGDYVRVFTGVAITAMVLVGTLFLIGILLAALPAGAISDHARLTLLRRVLERQRPPRTVEAHELTPLFYMPRTHVVCLVAAVGCAWALLTPLLALPHAWALVAAAALSLAALTVWPLARLRALLWALRHGHLALAEIAEHRLSYLPHRSFAEGRWIVRAPAGAFVARYATTHDGFRGLRVGRVAQVLAHPNKPKVLLIVKL